jgi:type II secretory pathway pseudopilin PulG
MLATLVGLVMVLVVVGGAVTLAGCLLSRRLPARQARRNPQQAATRRHTQQARRLAARWPLLAQTLGSATGTSGPASTPTRGPSSWSTTRA